MDEAIIRQELKRLGGNISKLARVLDLDYSEARQKYGSPNQLPRRPHGAMPEDFKSLGQPGLTRYVIAVKAADQAEWPERFQEAILAARENFDAGTHIMCQNTRSDGWVVLYSIPRKHPLKQPVPFFSREWGIPNG